MNLMSVEAYLSAKNAEQLFLFDRMASVGIAFRRSGEKYLRNQRLNSATIAGNSCESNPASPARAVGLSPRSSPVRSTANVPSIRSARGSPTGLDGRPARPAMIGIHSETRAISTRDSNCD